MSEPPHPDQAWVVVVNYGSHDLLEENLVHFDAEVRIVVVDNYHSDLERATVRALCERNSWLLVALEVNGGFGSGCNAGIRAAREAGAVNVVLVNPDARLTADVLTALSDQLYADPMVLVSPVMVTSTGAPHFHGSQVLLRDGRMRGRTWAEPPGPVLLRSDDEGRDWLSGACLGFSIVLWEEAGGLAEDYFLYWEDVDFSQRCVEAGADLCLRRDLVVVHDEGATHGTRGSRARSSVYYYYNCRNRLVYGARHLRRAQLLRWLVATPRQSWQILLRGGRRQLLHSTAPLSATVRGSLAGALSALPCLLGAAARVVSVPGPKRFRFSPTD